jgi:hypothetical protein
MKFDEVFDAQELPQGSSFDPLPAGWYPVEIVSAEIRDTKAGTGKYMAVGYKVTGDSHTGRTVFGNVNLRNPNPKAEEIGRQQLGDLMRAIGIAKLTDTDQLIGCICQIKLAVRKDEQYGDSNDVKAHKAFGATTPSAASAPRPNVQQSSGRPSPPWIKS